MKLAIEQARASKGEDQRTHPLVGVVVVKDGNVLASAYRGELDAGEHAEFTALERKLIDASLVGATIYTTLEPCTARNHPKLACAHRLIERRVARVVIGMLDPNPGICGRGVWLLRDARVATDFFPDVLMSEIEEINREFIRLHRPPARLETSRTPSVESKPPETPAPTEPAERARAAASPESTDKDEIQKQLLNALFDAMFDKKFEEGRQKYEELAAHVDEGQARRLKVIYLDLLYREASREDALEELRQLCGDADAGDFASGTLGAIAMLADDYATAIERYKAAAAKARDSERAANWLSDLANTYRKIGQLDEARRTVLNALAKSIGGSTRAELLIKLAGVYGDMRLPVVRAALLSRAAQLMPADTAKRFDGAYALSELEGTREASVSLYTSVLAMDKSNAAAANNLGVQCFELGMKGRSVALYRKAWEGGETIAAANLAFVQIEAGLFDDAGALLNEAGKQEHAHPNVASARTTLAQRRSSEEERWTDVMATAVKEQLFIAGLADAAVRETSATWSGSWITHDGLRAIPKGAEGKLVGEWGGDEKSNRRRVTADISADTATLAIEKWHFISTGLGFYMDELQGAAFVSADGSEMKIMLVAGKTPTFLTWRADLPPKSLAGDDRKQLLAGDQKAEP